MEGRKDLTGTSFTDIQVLLNNMNEEPHESEWLVDTTEKWCRDRAIYIALLESIQIADGGDDKQTRDAIPVSYTHLTLPTSDLV